MSARWCVPLLCSVAALAGASAAMATAPGVSGRIAYASDRNGNAELYSVSADGSAERRLTWTVQVEQAPAWSPDGQRLAYEREGPNGFRIWVMSADGSVQRELSPPVSGSAGDGDPAWSPDGERIAFASTRAGTWNLWVMDGAGGALRRVSDVFASDPAWSPDGSRLAFVGATGIGVVNLDGTGLRIVSAPGTFASGPSWSPDGREIVFTRNNTQGYPGELFVASADGSSERQLTSDGLLHARPSWSPDGSEIVFQRKSAPFGWELWAIGSDGGNERRLTSGANDLSPDWGSSQLVPEPSPPEAPLIEIYSPADGGFYLPAMQVQAFYFCSSAVSFVVSCEGDVALGEQIPLIAGSHTFTVRATDLDGRTATKTVTYQVLDIVPPEIELRTPLEGGAYELGAAITIDFSCSDLGGSGVALCGGDSPDGAPLDTFYPGTHTFHAYAIDNAGNVREVSATYTVVDRRPPLIDISSPADGATYELEARVFVRYSCRSASGHELVSCDGTRANGDALDTGSIGAKRFTVNAVEGNGAGATRTHTYHVVYAFSGFDAPVDASGTIKNAKAGEVIPLKFSLQGDHGLGVVVAARSRLASCADWSALDASRTGEGKLAYSESGDRYRFQFATERAWKNSCRLIELELADGTRQTVHVRFTN